MPISPIIFTNLKNWKSIIHLSLLLLFALSFCRSETQYFRKTIHSQILSIIYHIAMWNQFRSMLVLISEV